MTTVAPGENVTQALQKLIPRDLPRESIRAFASEVNVSSGHVE